MVRQGWLAAAGMFAVLVSPAAFSQDFSARLGRVPVRDPLEPHEQPPLVRARGGDGARGGLPGGAHEEQPAPEQRPPGDRDPVGNAVP